jgi:hypothetical protein
MIMPKRLLKHAGNRGVALAMLGGLWILTAVGLLVSPLKRPQLFDERFPLPLRIALWGLPGILAVVASLWRKYDATAWGCLIVPVVVRFLSYLAGWICYLAGWDQFAYPDGWRGATTIAIFLVFIKACAGGLDRPPVKREAQWTGDR